MGLFSFIGDALNDIFGGNQSRKDSQSYNTQNMAIQQQYALENMAVQNQYNIEAFERENEYNSPLAQQQRLRAAGINPNWTDEGTAISQQDSGVSASAPSGGMPSGSNTDILGDVVNMLSVGAQIRKTKADAKLAESQTKLNESQTRANDFALELDKEYRSAERSKGLEIGDSQIGVNNSQTSLNMASEEKTSKEAQQVFGRAFADISQALSQSDLNDSKKKEIDTLLGARLKEAYASVQNLLASAYKSTTEARYVPVHYQQEQQRINLQKQANQIQWKLADSLSNLQNMQARVFNEEVISKALQNDLNQWAYDEGISKRALEQGVQKMTIDIKNAWSEYHKNYPERTLGEFFENLEKDLPQYIEPLVRDIQSEIR